MTPIHERLVQITQLSERIAGLRDNERDSAITARNGLVQGLVLDWKAMEHRLQGRELGKTAVDHPTATIFKSLVGEWMIKLERPGYCPVELLLSSVKIDQLVLDDWEIVDPYHEYVSARQECADSAGWTQHSESAKILVDELEY